MPGYYPPVGFHFKVDFIGIDVTQNDHQFQSVSGLSVDMDTEEITEGGENRFKHTIPVRTKYQNLILKRGLLQDSGVIQWCRKALENFEITPIDLVVKLLNESHDPLISWNVVHAWPKKWSVSDFNAEQNSLVIETLEVQYQYFNILE